MNPEALPPVSGYTHVVKLTYFVTEMRQMPIVRDVRDGYVDRERPPTEFGGCGESARQGRILD